MVYLPQETKRTIIYIRLGSAWKESLLENSKPQSSQESGIQSHTTYVVSEPTTTTTKKKLM